jgi:hypothetical protein
LNAKTTPCHPKSSCTRSCVSRPPIYQNLWCARHQCREPEVPHGPRDHMECDWDPQTCINHGSHEQSKVLPPMVALHIIHQKQGPVSFFIFFYFPLFFNYRFTGVVTSQGPTHWLSRQISFWWAADQRRAIRSLRQDTAPSPISCGEQTFMIQYNSVVPAGRRLPEVTIPNDTP